MGKKSKKSKKTKKSKKSKGPQIMQGVSKFVFPNGDEYEGEYMAHRSGLVWRQGHGIYYTHDGQVYEGEWKDDKLDEKQNLKVSFPNGDQYFGRLAKNKFNGAGSYEFKNGTSLASQFANNKPAGQVALVDYLGNIWFGQAGKDHVLVFREHVFYYELDEDRGRGVPKHPKIEPKSEINQEIAGELEPELTYSELERRIFAKSTKTEADPILDDVETEWYRNSIEYDENMRRILDQVAKYGLSSLSENEKIWYNNYRRSASLLDKFRAKKTGGNLILSSPDDRAETPNLLDRFFGEEFRKSCRPVRVFYVSEPTQVEHLQEEEAAAEEEEE